MQSMHNIIHEALGLIFERVLARNARLLTLMLFAFNKQRLDILLAKSFYQTIYIAIVELVVEY